MIYAQIPATSCIFIRVSYEKKAPAARTAGAVFNEYGAYFHAVSAILSVLSFPGAQFFAKA